MVSPLTSFLCRRRSGERALDGKRAHALRAVVRLRGIFPGLLALQRVLTLDVSSEAVRVG